MPEDYKFPLNNALPARQCSFSLLNAFDFLRYSPSLDGVFCVHCVLFSNDNSHKLISLPEKGWSIPLQNGRGQGYDGAGNMTGLHNGLQARVRNLYPKMHFHWCSGHCLNLCLAKACEKVKKVVDHVQEITIAFKYSAKREQYFKEAILADSESAQALGRKNKLVMLSERWAVPINK